MACQHMWLVNVIYQNKSTWPVRMCDWSKQKYLIYQNKNTLAMFHTYKYQLKVNYLSFWNQIFNIFIIVSTSDKAIEDTYGTIFVIFIIYMML